MITITMTFTTTTCITTTFTMITTTFTMITMTFTMMANIIMANITQECTVHIIKVLTTTEPTITEPIIKVLTIIKVIKAK